jgi:hypothetical protein
MIHHPGRRHSRTAAGRRGFAVLEILAAATLVVLLGLALYRSVVATRDIRRSYAETRIVMTDLQEVMRHVVEMPVAQLPGPDSPFAHGRPIEGFAHLEQQTVVATYPDYVPGNPVPDPLEIVLTATWQGADAHPRTLELASVRVR